MRPQVGNIFCIHNLLPAFTFAARNTKQRSSSSNDTSAIKAMKFKCNSYILPWPDPATWSTFSCHTLAVPLDAFLARARHWLYAFLGQGCCCVSRSGTNLTRPNSWRTLALDAAACCCRCFWLRAQFSFVRCSWRFDWQRSRTCRNSIHSNFSYCAQFFKRHCRSVM